MDKLEQWLQGTVHADKVFNEARRSFVADMTGASFEECLHRATVNATAAAVRSFMGSEEAVERVALGIKNEGRRFMGFDPIASLSDLEDHRKAVGYAIRPAVDGEKHAAPEGAHSHQMSWKTEPKPLRMVLYWAAIERDDFVAFPFDYDAAGAADFATRWLETADYGKQPDHDGDNGRGWKLFNEGWGHVDSHWQAFVAVSPRWAMYGK